MIGGAAVRGCETFVDLLTSVPDVVGTEECQRFGGRAIAACASDFLVVAFD